MDAVAHVAEMDLPTAAQQGHVGLVQTLLGQGFPVDYAPEAGRTALHLAAGCGHLGVVRLLLDAGAQITAHDCIGWSVLHHAANAGQLEVIRFLLADEAVRTSLLRPGPLGGESAENTQTPLHVAAERGHVDAVRLLLPLMSKDIDTSAWGGCGPLHDAAGHGFVNVVRCLLEADADPEVSDEGGWGALHYAASEGHVEVAQVRCKPQLALPVVAL
jgi:ankyrin repeat protein